MMAFLGELAVSIVISLGVRATTAAAEALFAGRNAKPERSQTCSSCGKSHASSDIPRDRHDSARALPE